MRKLALVGLAALGVATAAYAGGLYESFPAATPPLTSAYSLAIDTNLSGGRAPQTVNATMANVQSFVLGGYADPNTRTASATAGAATLNSGRGVITSEALTTAAAAVYTLTWTNAAVTATSIPLCSVGNGTNTTVGPTLAGVKPAAGSVVIAVRNTHASAAFDGTIKVACAFIQG